MSQRPFVSDAASRQPSSGDLPAPDVVAFIRYCHRRRGARWPELYDEMCGVAARREFKGWDHAELAARGLTFSLLDMARLANWSRTILADEVPEADVQGAARLEPHAAIA